MTDLEILQNGTVSEKVYNVYQNYKPLIMKKASLYEKCSKGRIQKEDFVSDVYEALYYFVGRITINKVKDINKFSYYKSVAYAISRVLGKSRKVFDCEKLFDIDEDGNEKTQLVSKLGFSELSPDISKFMDRLTDRQKFVIKQRINGYTFSQIRVQLGVSYGTTVGLYDKAKVIYDEFFSMAVI